MRAIDMHSHLDEGQIATLRDDGAAEPWASAHLDACALCTAQLADAESRASVVRDALATLDMPVDVAAAKAEVRQRLDRARALGQPRRRLPLGWAAAILLVTAGAAAALPWSPLSRLWRAPSPASLPTPATQATPPVEAPVPTSVTVDAAGGIEVIVSGAAAGGALDVVWNDGVEARVAAPRGSRFMTATGRVEIDAAAGALLIEIPRSSNATIVVNGRTYLERSADGLAVVEPAAEVTDERVRFLVRAP